MQYNLNYTSSLLVIPQVMCFNVARIKNYRKKSIKKTFRPKVYNCKPDLFRLNQQIELILTYLLQHTGILE